MDNRTPNDSFRKNESAKTVVISLNPNSGAKDQVEIANMLANELGAREFDVQILTDIEQVKTTVHQLLTNNDLAALVAAGGDGTVSLLVNSLPADSPIAILPLGTENLLAKYLGIKCDPVAVAEMIVNGRLVHLDAGRANGKLFLVMASCGFDADVVNRLHSNRKGHIHHWSYAKPILGAIRRYRYPFLKISIVPNATDTDGAPDAPNPTMVELGGGRWLFVFNVPRYAMNLPFVADADPTDGLMDVLTFRGGKLLRSLFYLATVVLRRHRKWGYAQHQKLAGFRIESDEPVAYQLDGDPGGMLPLEIDVVRSRLTVFVPATFEV